MQRNLISIIVPIYNSEESLNQCIDSIIRQTHQNIELILVDDGSFDNSGSICDKYALNDDRIKVIHKINCGVSAARNTGIINAQGEYIQFVDSDDFIDEKMCEKLIHRINEDNSDIVVCGYTTVYDEKKVYTQYDDNLYDNLSELSAHFSDLYLNCFFNSIWDKLYKRSKIKDYFDENLSLGEDLKFNLSYLKKCNSVSVINECLYNYVVRASDSLSSKYRENMFELILYTNNLINYFCDENVGSNVNKTGINTFFISNILGSIQLLVYSEGSNKDIKLDKIEQWITTEEVANANMNSSFYSLEHIIGHIMIRHQLSHSIYNFFKIKGFLHNLLKK